MTLELTELLRRRSLAGKLEGVVVSIAEDGDGITDISAQQLAEVPTDESVSISCEGHRTVGVFSADHSQPAMTFIAVNGNSGFLELTLVDDSVSEFLGIKIGSRVQLKW